MDIEDEEMLYYHIRGALRAKRIRADESVLANYLVALIVEERLPREELKEISYMKMKDFLGRETEDFIQDMLQDIDERRYLSRRHGRSDSRRRRSSDDHDTINESRHTRRFEDANESNDVVIGEERKRRKKDSKWEERGTDRNTHSNEPISESRAVVDSTSEIRRPIESRDGEKGTHPREKTATEDGTSFPHRHPKQVPGATPPHATKRAGKDYSNTSIYVREIPPSDCNIKSINDHFGKFGTIKNIQINIDKRGATVQYTTHEMALKAISSPDVIFNNRFVSVVWARKNEPRRRQPYAHQQFAPRKANSDVQDVHEKYNQPAMREISKFSYVARKPEPKEKPDVVEVAKPPVTGVGRAEPVLDDAAELLRKRKKLISEQISMQKRLLEKVNKKEITREEAEEIANKMKSLTEGLHALSKKKPAEKIADPELPAEAANKSQTVGSMRADVEESQEAEDTQGLNENDDHTRRPPPTQRKRKHFAETKIDNRPKTLKIVGLSDEDKEVNAIRSTFRRFGKLEGVQQVEDALYVTFRTRAIAESASRYAMSKASRLASGDEKLRFFWANPPVEGEDQHEEGGNIASNELVADNSEDEEEDYEEKSWRRR